MLLLRGATRSPPLFHCWGRSFNTCSSCEEQRPAGSGAKRIQEFQYMLLLRGATNTSIRMTIFYRFQYMLLLRGATGFPCRRNLSSVSIHAPLARSNCGCVKHGLAAMRFQYMLLLRGATFELTGADYGKLVSIHAPLARSNSGDKTKCRNYEVSIHAPLARSNSKKW